MIKFNLKKKIKGLDSGFTLLEALVAISILMVAVSAPITIAQKGLSSAVYSKDQMIAAYLAQDAIEYIKNKRDELSINDVNYDWNNLVDIFGSDKNEDLCIGVDNSCSIDTITGTVIKFDSNTTLKKNDNNFFGHLGTISTKFTREINITLSDLVVGSNPAAYDSALVTVKVKWSNDNPGVTVYTKIYNY